MLVTNEEKNWNWMPKVERDHLGNPLSMDGIVLDDIYELRYRSESNGREVSLGKFSGHLMMMHVWKHTNCLLHEETGTPLLNHYGSVSLANKEINQPYLQLYGTALCDPQRFKKIKKDYGDLEVNKVSKALKNNRKGRDARNLLIEQASVYFFVLTELYRCAEEAEMSSLFQVITLSDQNGHLTFEYKNRDPNNQLTVDDTDHPHGVFVATHKKTI